MEKLFKEMRRLESWDVKVEWVRKGEWFKVRGGEGYESVMFDFKRRGMGIVGGGNFGCRGEYEFDMFRRGVIEDMGLEQFVNRMFRYYD